MTMQLGFVGLGIMGRPMALNLMRGGHSMAVYARRAASMQPLADAGAVTCASPAQVAARSDVIFVMVSDTPDVEQVILGPGGCIEGAAPGAIIVDMSTISPAATRRIADLLAAKGIEMLDAPVSGGEIGAVNGTLSIMVGGNAASFERAKPLFELMGKNIVHIGANAAGQVAKSCNQIVAAVTIEAVAEALLLAQANGVDAATVREALLGGFAYSRVLELHGRRMLEADYAPGFKAALHQKDMRIVLQSAHELGVALPAAALATQHINALVGSGEGGLDSSAIYRVLERMSAPDERPQESEVPAGRTAPGAKAPQWTGAAAVTERVGFIGLGVMGRPMALNLMRAGHPLHVYARRPAALAPLVEQGAAACASPAELATRCDVVCIMVTAGADVEAVVLGPDGILEGAPPGLLVVDHSTIAPATARRVAVALAARGVDFLDAPVSGGEKGAIDATLSIMVGGSQAAFTRAEPVLRELGKTVLRVGESGAGQVAKAANQLAIGLALQGMAEEFTLARASGVDPAQILEALRGGAAASRILEVMGAKMISRDFRPGVESRLHHKDVRIALDCAAAVGLAVPGAALAAQTFSALMGRGGGRQDSSAVVTVVEAMRNES